MTTHIVVGCILCCLTCSLVLAADANTSSTTGTIKGIVVDPQGNPMKDCIVSAQQDGQKMRDPIQATTDDKGAFELKHVPQGDYNLNVRTRDLKGKAIRSVSVTAGQTADVGKLKLKMK